MPSSGSTSPARRNSFPNLPGRCLVDPGRTTMVSFNARGRQLMPESPKWEVACSVCGCPRQDWSPTNDYRRCPFCSTEEPPVTAVFAHDGGHGHDDVGGIALHG
jgi:hypothetical protein